MSSAAIWSYVQNLLSLESSSISSSTNETKNFSYKKLSKAIIRCISTAHTASNEVQSSVMKSVCQIIEVADRTDGTYTRDEIFHLLGEGWATKFSNEDRSALFRSLLKEQVRTHEHYLQLGFVSPWTSLYGILDQNSFCHFMLACKCYDCISFLG